MISTRVILSAAPGLFCLALGLFALLRSPSSRLHRSFALYNLWMCVSHFSGWIFYVLSFSYALTVYRTLQAGGPLTSLFLNIFLFEFAGIAEERAPVIARRIMTVVTTLWLPFYPTSLIMKTVKFVVVSGRTREIRIPGPLQPVNLVILFSFFAVAFITTIYQVRHSSGTKRNQAKFVAFGMALGVLAIIFYALSFNVDLPWIYFPLQTGMNAAFAYAIFKYALLDFNAWMKRAVMIASIYLPLLSVPALLFFPFHGWFFSKDPALMVLIVLGYGVCFSLAPTLATYLNHQADKKRWKYLREQIDVVRFASERLADETSLSLDQISNRVVDVLKDFYWDRLKNPVAFIVALVMNQRGESAFATAPRIEIDSATFADFVATLQGSSAIGLPLAFNDTIVDRKLGAQRAPTARTLEQIRSYLKVNQIDLCCPCLHDGKLFGVLILGPKTNGIFGPEETSMLQMVASHAAMAGRKSELLEQTRQLGELDALKKELISNITHEFKSPLANVENAVQILLRDARADALSKDTLNDFLGMIQSNVDRLGGFIHNLLEVSKIEQSKLGLRLERHDLIHVIDDVVDLLEPLRRNKNLSMTIANREPISMLLDQEIVKEVLYNVVLNALKFSEKGGVTIDARRTGTQVRIEVRDTGRGIERQHLALIFERFFQVPNDVRGTGSGLGLAIAKGWTEQHGGRLWAESGGLGRGSTFVLELPAQQAREESV